MTLLGPPNVQLYCNCVPEHQDPSGFSQVRWHPVKQVGMRPSPRSGMSATVASGSNKVFLFGGVQDVKEDEEDLEGKFFNELYTVHVENEKASWLRGDYGHVVRVTILCFMIPTFQLS